jgi:site-specific recombinase XerC
MERGKRPAEDTPRRGPLDAIRSSRGEDSVSLFPPIAAVRLFLTFVLVQGRVKREPGPGVGATPRMP